MGKMRPNGPPCGADHCSAGFEAGN